MSGHRQGFLPSTACPDRFAGDLLRRGFSSC